MLLSTTVEFTAVTCFHCTAMFAITKDHYAKREGDHGSFWCPVCGGSQAYMSESHLEREKRLRAAAENRVALEVSKRDQAEAEARSATVRLAKLKKRVALGMCPDCHRTFKQLARHMETKHGKKP